MTNFADAVVVHATDLNALLKVVGGTQLAGTLPSFTTSAGFLIQAGSVVLATNSGGGGVINFPSAFPNGLLTCLVTPGDTSAGSFATVTNIASQSTASYQGFVYSNSGAVVNGTVRVNYIAIGF